MKNSFSKQQNKKYYKEKIINIDIIQPDDLFEKYNKKKVSKDLIEYIIHSTPKFSKKDTLKIVIHSNIKESTSFFIREGFQEEYQKIVKEHYYNNIIQFIYLLVGIFFLSISTVIDKAVLKEIILIGGWVLIWTMVELEIFSDASGRRKKRILKKLIHSEVIEKKSI